MKGDITHLDDDLLLGIGLAGGREIDALALEHLTRCRECDARLRLLVRELETDRREAAAEVSALFSPARFAAQRARIMRRLNGLGRAARVLEFPDRIAHSGDRGRSGAATRWIAAAATIGLVAGLGTGVLVDRRFIERHFVEQRTTDARLAPAPAMLSDDDLLGDIDQALGDLSAPELRAIDALTPVVHEVVYTPR